MPHTDFPGSCVYVTTEASKAAVMQRADSLLGALRICKPSWHTCILCAPSAQISAVLKNVTRASPKRKAVPEFITEITSLG